MIRESAARVKSGLRGIQRSEILPPFVLFSGLACIYTHPLILNLPRVIRGPDYFQFLWNFWWIRESLTHLQSPFFTEYQYHPTGTSLAFHTTSYHWAYLSVPFQYFLPRQVILNMFYVISFIATGITTFFLLRYLNCSKRASFLGGFIFAFCGHRVDRFHFQEIDSLGTMYIPLFMYCLLRIYELTMKGQGRGALKYGALAGAALGLTALCSWYNGLFLVIFGIFAFAYKTIQCKRLPVKALSLMALVFVAMISPFVTAMVVARASGEFPSRSYASMIRSSEYNNADALGYLVPSRATPGVGLALLQKLGFDAPMIWVNKITSSYYGNPSEKGVFPGYTVIALSILSLYCTSRSTDRRARGYLIFLYVTCVAFVIFSFGPTLYVHGRETVSFMPYRILMGIPVLNVARAPSRFVMMAMFCLALIAATTFDYSKKYTRGKVRNRIFFLVILILLIAETLPFRPHPLRAIEGVESQFFVQLSREPNKKMVLLNVPVDFKGARGGGGLYLFHQTIHHQKIVGGYLGREPAYVLRQLESSPFLRALHHRAYEKDKRISLAGISDAEMIESLENLTIDYVVIYKNLLGEDYFEVKARFKRILGADVFADAQVEVFEVRSHE